MKHYDWSEMTPRERDVLVAEKVMGWTVHSEQGVGKYNPDVDYECSYVLDETPENYPEELRGVTGQIICRRVPDFTTDIKDAWEVVEKMMDENWNLSLDTRYEDSLTRAVFWHTWDSKAIVSGLAHKVPEAICLSALRAVGGDV